MTVNNKEYTQWKKYTKRKRTLFAIFFTAIGIGSGVGIGYEIWHSVTNTTPIPPIINPKNENGTDWKGWISGTLTIGGWNENNKTCRIVSSKNYVAKDLVIPTFIEHTSNDTNNMYRIIGIEEQAFNGANLQNSITIADSITSIDNGAFYGCKLPKIIVDENNKNYVLASNVDKNNVQIVVPKDDGVLNSDASNVVGCLATGDLNLVSADNVTSIAGNAFAGCAGLKSVTFSGLTSSIGDYAFVDCTSLEEIRSLDNVATIGEYAFVRCYDLVTIKLNNFAIGQTNLNWNEHSFTKVSEYGGAVFVNDLMDLTVAGCLHGNGLPTTWNVFKNIDGTDWGHDTSKSFTGSIATTTSEPETGKWFGTCTITDTEATDPGGYQATDLEIPEFVKDTNDKIYRITKIGDEAFYDGTHLDGNLDIPDSITSIGVGAFESNNLINVDISNSVTSIEDYTFANCPLLQSITFHDSITSIGSFAFWKCISFRSFVISDCITSIGTSAFQECSSLRSITIPSSVISLGSSVFAGEYVDHSITLSGFQTNVKPINWDPLSFERIDSGGGTIYTINGTMPSTEALSMLMNDYGLTGQWTAGTE